MCSLLETTKYSLYCEYLVVCTCEHFRLTPFNDVLVQMTISIWASLMLFGSSKWKADNAVYLLAIYIPWLLCVRPCSPMFEHGILLFHVRTLISLNLGLWTHKRVMIADSRTFVLLAGSHFSISCTNEVWCDRRYRSVFGITSAATSIVWNLIRGDVSGNPIHLLWALHFLKNYCKEHNGAMIWGCDEKTYRKWVWKFITEISNQNQVRRHKCFYFSNIWTCKTVNTNN